MTGLVHRRCRPLLGTLVEVAVGEGDAAAVDAAFAAVARVHATMSFHDGASDLARLRQAPSGDVVRVDADTVLVLRLAERLHRRSGGLFDVTAGRALVVDGFLPRPPGIDLRRIGRGADAIKIVDDHHVLCRAPVLIDLGGIAKGFAVDRAIEALARAGVPHALVNAGGDLRVLGDEPQAVHLRAAGGALDGVLMLADGALASSSNLHERRTVRGRVTVPHRGYEAAPMPSPQAVSVLAPSCVLADAMTKIALADPVLASAMLAEAGGVLLERPDSRRVA